MNYDDLLLNEINFPLFPESFSVDLPNLFVPFNKVAALTKQVKSLSIDFHTQTLRIEVERVKRQKLSSTLKKVRKKMVKSHHLLYKVLYDKEI